MILFVNGKQEIHDVGSTTDKSLSPLYVKDEGNPFKDWSVAKICCYKVSVSDGVVTMFTPYVDSNIISHIDQLGNQVESVTPYKAVEKASIGETEVTFVGVPEGVNIITSVNDLEKNVIEHNVSRSEDIVKVSFEPLNYAADVTISVN